jgi:aspartate/methionine/tyrosine aminotransferase
MKVGAESNEAGKPELVVESTQLAGSDSSPERMLPIPGSRMFEINEALKVYLDREPGAAVFDASQGDGGASLPGVSRELLDAAHKLQVEHGTGYDKPFGTPAYRRAVVEDYWGLDASTGWGPSNVIACQGGRDALVKAYDAVQFLGHHRRGDFVVVSRVPWISYNWGPYAVGANVMLAPGREDSAWALTPEAIVECSDAAAAFEDRRIALLVITSPDNPTGRSMSPERQIEIARAAFSAGVPYVLFDWIYHRVTDGEPHDLNGFLNALEREERERCIFLDGITKSLGASNVRNAHLVASEEVVRFIQSRASHAVIPSFYSLAVAMAAYRMGFTKAAAPIIEPTNASRVVVREFLAEREINNILGDGYYAFLDIGRWLEKGGFADSAELGATLAEGFGIAVVPGVYFSDFGRNWIRFSYALPPDVTGGALDRLWQALSSF